MTNISDKKKNISGLGGNKCVKLKFGNRRLGLHLKIRVKQLQNDYSEACILNHSHHVLLSNRVNSHIVTFYKIRY